MFSTQQMALSLKLYTTYMNAKLIKLNKIKLNTTLHECKIFGHYDFFEFREISAYFLLLRHKKKKKWFYVVVELLLSYEYI